MFKNIRWRTTFITAIIAAILFCFFAFIFIQQADYSSSWMLYVGSVIFFFAIGIFSVIQKPSAPGNDSTTQVVFASLVTTITGIILCCITCFIILLIVMPGFIESGPAKEVLQNAPPATMEGKTNGLVFKVFFAAILINFFGGSIASIIIAFYIKRNSKKG